MNSGGDDDRWTITNPTAGLETYTSFEGGITLSGATVNVKFNIDTNTGYPIIQTVFRPCLTSSLLHFEEKTSAEKIILSYVGKGECGMASAVRFHVCPNRMLDYWTPSGRHSHQRVDPGRERLIRIIKGLKRGPIGEATICDMMIQKKSFLVLGLSNAKGSTKTFPMMVNEQGWTNIEERLYHVSE